MREVIVKLYKFSELSEKAQDKAIENRCRLEHEYLEASLITESLKDTLSEQFGLPNLEVFWSLNNYQGDGVAFQGEVDLDALRAKSDEADKILKEAELLSPEHFNVSITHRGNYHHYNSMDVSVEVPGYGDCEDPGRLDDLAEDLEEFLKDYIREASAFLAKLGYAEIEFMTSEETAREALEECDEIFLADGSISRDV